MLASLLVLLENLHANLENALYNRLVLAFSLSCAFLLSMFCLCFQKFCTFSFLFYLARDILLVNGEMAEFRGCQVMVK